MIPSISGKELVCILAMVAFIGGGFIFVFIPWDLESTAKPEVKPAAKIEGFTEDELRLNYSAWRALIELKRAHLSEHARGRVASWGLWDLMNSPMDDKERGLIRYGFAIACGISA